MKKLLLSVAVAMSFFTYAEVPVVLFPDDSTEALYAWRNATCSKPREGEVKIELTNEQPREGSLQVHLLDLGETPKVTASFTDRRNHVWTPQNQIDNRSGCRARIFDIKKDGNELQEFKVSLTCQRIYTQRESFHHGFRILQQNPIHCTQFVRR